MKKEFSCCNASEKLNWINEIINNKSKEKMPELIEMLKDNNFEVREKAAEALVAFENDSTIDELLKAIATDDPNYRNSAIEALILMGEKTIPFLINELDNSGKDVRKFIVDVMGHIKSDKAVPFLIKMVDDEDENVSQGACESLGKIASVKAVDKLIEALTKGEWLQFSAIEALGKIGENKAVPYIINIMMRSNDWIKYVAIEALGNMKNEMAIQPLINELNTENEEILNSIFFSIEKIITNSNIFNKEKIYIDNVNIIVTKLKKIYTNTIDRNLKKALLKIASYFKVKCCYEKIIEEIISSDQEISDTAIDAIIELGNEIIPVLEKMLDESKDKNFELEIGILFLFGEIVKDDDKILNKVLEYLKRSEEEIREVALQSAVKISKIKTIEMVSKYIDDESGNIRKTALDILTHFKIEINYDKIIEKLNDKYKDVQMAASNYCIKMNKEELNHIIIEKLENQLVNFKENFAKNLIEICGKLKLKSSVGTIITLMEERENLKIFGIHALGNIQSKMGLDYLLEKIHDKDVVIKKLAADALGKINFENAIPDLLKMLDDNDSWVRYFSANALNNFQNNMIRDEFLNKLEYETTSHVIIEMLSGLNKYDIPLEKENHFSKFLEEKDEDVSAVAISCYKNYVKKNKNIRMKIFDKLKTDSWKIKNAVLDIIEGEKLDKEEIIKVLPLIKDDNMLVKEKALSIIGFNGEISLVVPMISTMMEESLEEITMDILSNAKEKDYDSLIQGLNSEYDSIRIFTANAMTIIADERAEQSLINALKDENWKVRYFCAEALGNIKSKNAIDYLLRLVEDENKYVMEAALRAIKQIGG